MKTTIKGAETRIKSKQRSWYRNKRRNILKTAQTITNMWLTDHLKYGRIQIFCNDSNKPKCNFGLNEKQNKFGEYMSFGSEFLLFLWPVYTTKIK
jgi:hypothetical protein